MHSNKKLRVVSSVDPALDKVAMGREWSQYIKTRDWDLLKFQPGKKPFVFEIISLDTEVVDRFVMSEATEQGRFREAFRYGVAKVLDFVDKNGQKHAQLVPDDDVQLPNTAVSRMSDAMLFGRFSECDIHEIGSIIFWRSFLRPGSVASYPLPRLLQLALVATAYSQAADQVAQTQSSQRSEKSPEPATPENGGGDTDATATE